MKLKNGSIFPLLLSLVACAPESSSEGSASAGELPGLSSAALEGGRGLGEGGASVLQIASEGEAPGECVVSEEVVEHTCLHVTYGPFASVNAQTHPGFIVSNINAPHTAYTVTLPGAVGSYEGGVLYEPAVSGDYAFFVAPDVEVTIYDSAHQPLTPERQGAVDAELCSALSEVKVFHLEEGEIYTVVFGPAEGVELLALVEYLGAAAECESCEHVHLEASADRWPLVRQDAEVQADHPLHFEIPEHLSVSDGDARGALVRLSLRHGAEPEIRCWYFGSLTSSTQLELAFCNGGVHGGEEVEADLFQLRVVQPSLFSATTAVELELEDEACGEHDHEHGH